jgi:hypothetical protein
VYARFHDHPRKQIKPVIKEKRFNLEEKEPVPKFIKHQQVKDYAIGINDLFPMLFG